MSSINLGPYNVNKPTTDEKANIRQSLGLYSASLLDATFDNAGNVLTISDPNDSDNVITFDKTRLNQTVAASLETSRSFSVSGDVTTTAAQQFNGTANVNIPVSINANAITTSKIADGSITAIKIADSSIAHGKLTPGGPSWNTSTFSTSTNTAFIGNNTFGAVTLSLGGNKSGAGDAIINFKTATSDDVQAAITRVSGSDGNFAIANTGSGQLLIKQTGNVPIIFYTNNTERMRIINSGSIGIGKDNPATLLDVNGVITATRYDGKISSSALVSGAALELNGDGLLQVKDEGITTAKLADSTSTTTGVTTAKLADGSVTTAKLENSSSTTTGVTTAKLANGSVTPIKLSQPLTLATAQNTTSGTSIDFTGIPSWVKRITVMLNGISGNSSSSPIIQLGDSGGIENSGYAGSIGYSGASSGAAAFSSGFLFNLGVGAVTVTSGVATLLNISGNVWIYAISAGYADQAYSLSGGGTKTLSATLDRLRITTVNGTDTFDAGSVNIMYE